MIIRLQSTDSERRGGLTERDTWFSQRRGNRIDFVHGHWAGRYGNRRNQVRKRDGERDYW